MAEATSEDPAAVEDHADTADRMCAIAAELTAVGLTTQLHETGGVVDLTATLHRSGYRDIEVIVDGDGYIELRYWANPDATSAQIATTVARALGVITITKSDRPERDPLV